MFMKLLCCIYYIPLCSTLFRWNTCVVDIQEEEVQVQALSVDYVKLGLVRWELRVST